MADIAITAANVVAGAGAVNDQGTAGEVLTAGMGVYKKSTDSNKYWKSQNDGTAEEATFAGIAMNGAAANQPVVVQQSGELVLGGTMTVGDIVIVSAAAGAVCPFADIGTNKLSVIGYAKTASILVLKPVVTGINHA